MNIELFTAFLLITIVLIIAPGPIVTLIISTGVLQGRRAALITVAGTTLGNALLLAAIASALGWVHAHADLLFNALRWTGAAYLIWLGIQAWRHAGEGDARLMETGRARFVRGILVALSNPKTIVFFTAFLPQFIDPRLPAGPQLRRDVRRHGRPRRRLRLRLGDRGGHGSRLVHEAEAGEAARPAVRNRPHRRRRLAFARQTLELTGAVRAQRDLPKSATFDPPMPRSGGGGGPPGGWWRGRAPLSRRTESWRWRT